MSPLVIALIIIVVVVVIALVGVVIYFATKKPTPVVTPAAATPPATTAPATAAKVTPPLGKTNELNPKQKPVYVSLSFAESVINGAELSSATSTFKECLDKAKTVAGAIGFNYEHLTDTSGVCAIKKLADSSTKYFTIYNRLDNTWSTPKKGSYMTSVDGLVKGPVAVSSLSEAQDLCIDIDTKDCIVISYDDEQKIANFFKASPKASHTSYLMA